MSREAIAAALARHELSAGERLVAFSLASFADRDGRARPGTPAAAGRAGLKRSWFLEARELLERRGLVVVEQAGTGRGRASTLCLPFAEAGPWWEGEINAELFEAVLGYSRAQGAARLLLAAAAALADEQRVLEGFTTRQLCTAAGLSDTTYRRARTWLLGSGELVLVSGNGGRGKANCWEVADPRACAGEGAPVGRRRVAPPAGQRPLLASVSSAAATAVQERPGSEVDEVDSRGEDRLVQAVKGGGDRTLSAQNHPVGDGVSRRKGAAGRTLSGENRPVSGGVLVGKGAAGRTLSPETPPETPPKNPPPNARAGRGPQNPKTHPPNPPEGGGADPARHRGDLPHRARPQSPPVGHARPRDGALPAQGGGDGRSCGLGADPRAPPRCGRREHVRHLAGPAAARRRRCGRNAGPRSPGATRRLGPDALRSSSGVGRGPDWTRGAIRH